MRNRLSTNVRPFDLKHLAAMNRWLVRNGHPALGQEHLSRIGFIIPGVAAGFMARAEGLPVGIIDGLVTNPLCSSNTRNGAIQAILDQLMQEACQQGIKRVLAFSAHDSLLARVRNMGFADTNLTVLVGEV